MEKRTIRGKMRTACFFIVLGHSVKSCTCLLTRSGLRLRKNKELLFSRNSSVSLIKFICTVFQNNYSDVVVKYRKIHTNSMFL